MLLFNQLAIQWDAQGCFHFLSKLPHLPHPNPPQKKKGKTGFNF